jgi:hypothetical protein
MTPLNYTMDYKERKPPVNTSKWSDKEWARWALMFGEKK